MLKILLTIQSKRNDDSRLQPFKIEPRRAFLILLLAFSGCLNLSCGAKTGTAIISQTNFPDKVLWAWERPENLEFLDANNFAVAYLAQTLILERDAVVFRPRRQPLKVNPNTKLIAVTRIETVKTPEQTAILNNAQKTELLELILKTLDRKNVSAVQIDFDAAASEREFYRELLVDLRPKLPADVSLSITALASVCIGDRWFGGLPVAEAVPMIFRMGADDKKIKNMLERGEDFREPLCRTSYGVALDEIFPAKLDASRRLYVFNNRAWTPADVRRIETAFR